MIFATKISTLPAIIQVCLKRSKDGRENLSWREDGPEHSLDFMFCVNFQLRKDGGTKSDEFSEKFQGGGRAICDYLQKC